MPRSREAGLSPGVRNPRIPCREILHLPSHCAPRPWPDMPVSGFSLTSDSLSSLPPKLFKSLWHAPCFMSSMEQTPPMTINQIQLSHVDSILAQQGERKSWGAKEHVAAIRKLAVSLGLPPERASEFSAILKENGFGGNASQFRQWLTKSPQSRLAASSASLDDYS